MKSFMQKIITADNTETFLNKEVGESYHSQTGAVEEALKKYAIPCEIRKLAKEKSKVKILDMFFGMGYNSAMAISEALAENPNCEIEVVGIENDPLIVQKIQEVNPPIPFFVHYKKLNANSLEFKEGNVVVKLLLSDAREVVKQLKGQHFDAVFYDPFSPTTDPEMWTEDLFKEMYRVLKDSGILATYSCARMVRDNIAASGFIYEDGPIVGRRGPGTLGRKWV